MTSVIVRDGRALGVRTADGGAVRAVRAVLADVSAPALYGGLVGWEHLPGRLREQMRRFDLDPATFKVDWALTGPIPWASPGAARAGTVHLAPDLDALTRYNADLATGRVPAEPFALLGQMTTADPARSPAGTESVWAYTHVPHRVRGDAGPDGITGAWDERERVAFAERLEGAVERLAPGFRDRIAARRIVAPPDFADRNANLPGGGAERRDVAAAPAARLPSRAGPRARGDAGRGAVPGVGVGASGGGVHGGCGTNAARAALAHA
ncbi:hypothetical protein BJF79_48390 [Actinomadura sp. CNU-125]|uniref:phytoene desaturase family protein n=1 Tax=Actinomadura sp. CNU-125 TaxID=1904961 RepID=UPI000962D223|nr:hypothetical protein [Actinomadura sp. CNU-125]OLT17747.1 hypothetical protein BJF79_48390 [Actinomadura sp. CNU-125]